MKILFVTLGFYPAVAWGGTVTVVYQNAQELLRRGHQVTVCCSNLMDKSSRIASGTFTHQVDGIKVHYIHTYSVSSWRGTIGPTFIVGGLMTLFQEIQAADVVHANGTRNMVTLASAFIAYLLDKPFILQPHGTLPHILNSILLKQLFDGIFGSLLVGRAKALIALQESEHQQILTAGGDPTRIHIVPNGLTNKTTNKQGYQNQFKERYGIPEDNKVVLFLGRINRKKGTDLLVKAFARLKNRQGVSLVIAGPDDGQLAEVQDLVKEFSLEDQTLFTGLLSGEDIYRAYTDADIFVLPCRTDTFPMAILEACQSGTPVVVTETCEIADKIDGIAGETTPFNAEALASTLDAMLLDEAKRAKYGTGGRRLLETEFSLQAVGDKLETIYADVVNSSH